MQSFQKSFNAFSARFRERWETQPLFRVMWTALGAGGFLLMLCLVALIGVNLFGSFLASAGATGRGSVTVGVNGNTSTFPLNKLTPQGNNVSGVSGTPVATTTFAPPTATPTVTPTLGTPTSGTPAAGTPFTVSAQPVGLWKVGQNGGIQNIVTTPAMQNALMTISMQFGTTPTCTLPSPLSVQLDSNGTFNKPISFQIPSCAVVPLVTVTYHIDGSPDYPDTTTFHTS
jgi:hypothetical protein